MDPAILRDVRKVIVHANCADGRASAIILHEALPDAEIVEMAHNSAEHRALQPEAGLLFCDFIPWLPGDAAERVELLRAWVDAGTIVLDHHKGAEDIVRAFGERGGFADEERDPGVSGAALARCEVWHSRWSEGLIPGEEGPCTVLASLVGIRDTWQRRDPRWDEACALAAWLTFAPLEFLLDMSISTILRMGKGVGSLLLEKRRETVSAAAASAVRMTIACRRVAIVPGIELASDVMDVLGDAVDIVASFGYVHEPGGAAASLQWSLRSQRSVDVSAIAKRHGGGGHTRAAGFSVEVGSWLNGRYVPSSGADPYLHAAMLLGDE